MRDTKPPCALQLKAFKDQSRADPDAQAYMWGMASLFEQGVPVRQIPPCASCHGAHAEGMATFPRLAGQRAPYLFKQLLVSQSVLRIAPVMHSVIKDLTKDQMQAVVAYLESI